MKSNLTFEQASRPKSGWRHATGDHLTYMHAEAVALKACMNHRQIYEWAVRHSVDLKPISKMEPMEIFGSDFFTAVLNNKPLSTAA